MEWLNQDFIKFEYLGWGLLGLLLVWLSVRRRRWNKDTREDPRNKEIRQYQADLRMLQKQFEEAQKSLADRESEYDGSVTTVQELNAKLATSEAELVTLRADLQDEIQKTRDLRVELTDQAQERVREHVSRRDAETQLEVAQAGSEAVLDEISRLQEEQEQADARKSVTDTHVDIDIK